MAEIEDKGRLWLFDNTYKKTDKHPIYTGSGEISREVLKRLVNHLNTEKPEDGIVRLQCAAWQKESRGGKSYVFVTFDFAQKREPNRQEPDNQSTGHADNGGDSDTDIPFDIT